MHALRTVLLVSALVAPAAAEEPQEALARGRLESDLGRHAEAVRIFTAVVESEEATPAQRREARARLGAALRDAGDPRRAATAFEAAWRERGDDPDERRLLFQAAGVPLPSDERWQQVWREAALAFDGSGGARAVWPGVPDEPCPERGHAIRLDFEQARLGDVYRLFADVSGLNVVVAPGTHGMVSYAAAGVPWDRALCEVLAASGYVSRRNGNVIWSGPPEQAPQDRVFEGRAIDVELRAVALQEALEGIAAEGGVSFRAAEGVAGSVTLVLRDVPWDQAFDLVAHLNGLRWERTGDTLVVRAR